jgi:methylmalonyl-CoA mutase cobalamin-binding subunit
MRLLHERRAKLIHSLVDELSLDVKDWGGTDAPQEKEIVDLVIAFGPAVIGAAATIIAAMITSQRKYRVPVMVSSACRWTGTDVCLRQTAARRGCKHH